MKNISYEKVKNIMNEEYKNHVCISIDIMDDEIKKQVLDSVGLYDELSDGDKFDHFTIFEFTDHQVIDYKKINNDVTEEKIIIINPNKDNDTFEVSRKQNMKLGDGIDSNEFKLYSNGRLVYSLQYVDKYVDDWLVVREVILYTRIANTNTYTSNKYDFTYNGNVCSILGIDSDYFVLDDGINDKRLSMANSQIQKAETIFEANLNSILNLVEQTKVYQVKRKMKY